MLVIYFALVIISCVSAAPSRERFDVYDSFPRYRSFGPYATAYAGGGFFPSFVGGGFFPPFPSVYRDPFSWVPMFVPEKPWYEGENICKTEKTLETPEEMKEFMDMDDSGVDYSHESESCRGNNNKYVCYKRVMSSDGMKTKITKYECCLGFVRNPSGAGCIEIDLRYLMPTLRNMEASKLVSIIERAGMADDFHENNFTVFCPLDSALEAFNKDLEDDIDNEVRIKPGLQKLKRKTRLYNLLTSHLSPGFVKIDDLDDGNVLPSENPKNSIRVNVYFTPEKVVTANCVPILSGDHFARNGIIHVIEKLLPSPSKTVADIIAGDSQFSILKGMLSKAGMVQTLRNPNGSYTMFAPTDSALLSGLSTPNGGSDDRCTVSVMKHHIIDHVICSSALPHHARSLNTIGELLSLTRDQNNKLYVDGVQVVVRDLMATNGVVHIIDGILSTRQTKSVSQVLDDAGLYEFLALLELANLKPEFDSMENVTFFIPADEIIQGIPPNHLETFLRHNESLADVLRFHVVEGQTDFTAPDQLLHSKLENATVRFQVHIAYPQMIPKMFVQCATVLSADIKLCGGTLHVVDKLLLPPKVSLIEFLENVEGFSTLLLLLRATGLDSRLANEQFAYTLLAPTDDAFHELGDEALFRILEDVDRARDLVKMHILLNYVCCSQLKNDLLSGRRQIRTMDGSLLTLEKSTDGVLMVGGAHVVDCDIVATNGVIHMVDQVLAPDPASLLGGGYMDNLFILV